MSNTKKSWEQINSIEDIVCNYTPDTCLKLLQLIYSMHTAFPNILAAKGTVGTFEGRSRTSFLTNYTLKNWIQKFKTNLNPTANLGAAAVSRDPIELPTNGEVGNLTPSDMNMILFTTRDRNPAKESASGILGWYFPNELDHGVLCQVVNPYHTTRQNQSSAFINASRKAVYNEYTDAELIYICRYQISKWCSELIKRLGKDPKGIAIALSEYCNSVIRFQKNYESSWDSFTKTRKPKVYKSYSEGLTSKEFNGEKMFQVGKKFSKFPTAVTELYNRVKDKVELSKRLKRQIIDLLKRNSCFGLDTDLEDEDWENIYTVLITENSQADISTFSYLKNQSDYNLPTTLTNAMATKDQNGNIVAYKIQPTANDWLKTSGPAFRQPWNPDEQDLIIQQITKTKNDEIEFSMIGREFVLKPEDFSRFFLIPRDENGLDVILSSPVLNPFWRARKLKSSVCYTLGDSGWNEAAQNDDDPSGILKSSSTPSLQLDNKISWSPVMQMMVRDAYDKYGKIARNQEKVPSAKDSDRFTANALSAPSTPTFGNIRYNSTPCVKAVNANKISKKAAGQICAVCFKKMKTKNLKKDDWKGYLGGADSQEYDVDHIANLIFNELFKLNYSGKGFLNTCAECNRTFKSEKLWSPSIELWLALINRAANVVDCEGPGSGTGAGARYNVTKLTESYPWPGGLVTTSEGGITKGGIPGWHGDERSKPKGGYKTYTSIVSHSPSTLPAQYKTTYEMCVKKGKKNQARRELFKEGQGITTSNTSNPNKNNKLDITPVEGEAIILDRFALIFNSSDDDDDDMDLDDDDGGAAKKDDDGPGKNDNAIRKKLVNDIFRVENGRLMGEAGSTSGSAVLLEAYIRMISIYPVIASIQYAKNLENQALASGQLHPGVRGRLLSIVPGNEKSTSNNFNISVLGTTPESQKSIEDTLLRSFIYTANGINAKELLQTQIFNQKRAETSESGASMLPMNPAQTDIFARKYNSILFAGEGVTYFKSADWFEWNIATYMQKAVTRAQETKSGDSDDFINRVNANPTMYSYNDYLYELLGVKRPTPRKLTPTEYSDAIRSYEREFFPFLDPLTELFNNNPRGNLSNREMLFLRDLYVRTNQANSVALQKLIQEVDLNSEKYQKIEEETKRVAAVAKSQLQALSKWLKINDFVGKKQENGGDDDKAFKEILAGGKNITFQDPVTKVTQKITNFGQLKDAIYQLQGLNRKKDETWLKNFKLSVKKQLSNLLFYIRVINYTMEKRKRMRVDAMAGSESESHDDSGDSSEDDEEDPAKQIGKLGRPGKRKGDASNLSSTGDNQGTKPPKSQKNTHTSKSTKACELPQTNTDAFKAYLTKYKKFYGIDETNNTQNMVTLGFKYNNSIPSNIKVYQSTIIKLRSMLVNGDFDRNMPEILGGAATVASKYPQKDDGKNKPPFHRLLKPRDKSASIFWTKIQPNIRRGERPNLKFVHPLMDESAKEQPIGSFQYSPQQQAAGYGTHGLIYNTKDKFMYWWDQSDIFAALRTLCPRGNWQITNNKPLPTGLTTRSNFRSTIHISNNVGNDGESLSTVKIIGDGTHWKVAILNPQNNTWNFVPELNPNMSYRNGHHFSSNLHRVGGDCGPSSVIKAIQQVKREDGAKGGTRKNRKKHRQTKNRRKNKHKTKKHKRKKNKTRRKR